MRRACQFDLAETEPAGNCAQRQVGSVDVKLHTPTEEELRPDDAFDYEGVGQSGLRAAPSVTGRPWNRTSRPRADGEL